MEIEIQNCPCWAWEKYEFIVCRIYKNQFWFWGAYSNELTANRTASRLENGIMIHNIGKIEK